VLALVSLAVLASTQHRLDCLTTTIDDRILAQQLCPQILIMDTNFQPITFHDLHAARATPLTTEALRRIAELYVVESEIRGKPPDERRQVR